MIAACDCVLLFHTHADIWLALIVRHRCTKRKLCMHEGHPKLETETTQDRQNKFMADRRNSGQTA